MKKTNFLLALVLILASCSNKFEIRGTFAPELQIPDSTEIGIDLMSGDSTVTYNGLVQNNAFKICFDIPQEQLAILDFGELGATILAVEPGKPGKGVVNVSVGLNDDDEPVITKNGTLNNDFIQMYDDCEEEFYQALSITDETARDNKLQQLIDRIYRTLKGEENSLTDINTLSGQYGFINFFSVLSFDQVDTLCSLMNESTLSDKNMRAIYDYIQVQKDSNTGKQYKDISATTPNGNTLALSQLVGKTDYVLVDFWASWCGPCRRAMPEVKALYDKYNGKLQILGVSLDEDKSAWTGAINAMNLNWCHISDLQGWKAQGAQDYGVNAIPCTILIDKEGVIVGRNMPLNEIEALLNK